MGASRSTQGARLKNNHHTRTPNEHTSMPIITNIKASGATKRKLNPISHCSATAITPGHTRSGCREVDESIFSVVISRYTPLQGPFVHFFAGPCFLTDLRQLKLLGDQNLRETAFRLDFIHFDFEK